MNAEDIIREYKTRIKDREDTITYSGLATAEEGVH
jgi:hypothetical protein